MRYYVTRRKGRMAYVHRLVAEQMLGRPLRPGEEVHHRNGDKPTTGQRTSRSTPRTASIASITARRTVNVATR